jgi:hypothetical protein
MADIVTVVIFAKLHKIKPLSLKNRGVVTRNLTKNLTTRLDQNLFKFRHENPSSSVRKPRAGIPPRKT